MRYILYFVLLVGLAHTSTSHSTGFTNPLSSMQITQDFVGTHIGVDLDAVIGTNVFAITEGIVHRYYAGVSCYGGYCEPCTGGICPGEVLFIRHRKSNGQYFVAQYGHIQNVPMDLKTEGAVVTTGRQVAEIADYNPCLGGGGSCPHLHFGIWDSENNIPNDDWGYGDACWDFPQGCWVNPMTFLQNESPYNLFSCSWVSQSIVPMSSFVPGRLVTCMVKFKNEGNVTWQKTPGSQYVELASTNINEEIVGSFFNDPLEPGLGWLNQFAPCTFSETEVPPGEIATFTFTGRVNLNAKPGHYKIYFGPVHNGEILPGWGEMHFPIDIDAGWISSTLSNNCIGNVDNQGYKWNRPEFTAGAPQWIMETIPDGGWGCGNCDRYYRYWYQYDGIQNGSGVAIKLFSDDGCELWVNGLRVGGWGRGTCHQAGCVNGGGGGCFTNDNYPPVDITNYLDPGINMIAVHVSQGPGGAYFNCTFSSPPLNPSMPGVCCMGSNCTQVSESFTWEDCIASQGEMFAGGQYDCQSFPPCQNTNMCIGDPILTFITTLPVPTVPASLSFSLVDSIPYSAWYALPSVLGGDTIHINNFTGGFTVYAQQSFHSDTVDLLITDYSFEAPSVLINGIPTGTNSISLDSSQSPTRHGTFNRVSKQVSLVIPSILINDLFSSANPVHSQSQILGSFDESTGFLTTASESVSLLPPCCQENRGDLNGDGNDANIIDLTFLVDFIFRGSGDSGDCGEESDVNGDGASANILDLTFLVDFMFRGGSNPPSC